MFENSKEYVRKERRRLKADAAAMEEASQKQVLKLEEELNELRKKFSETSPGKERDLLEEKIKEGEKILKNHQKEHSEETAEQKAA